MSTKRMQGKRAKGFHLTTDTCEMLAQILIVIGDTESSHVDTALRSYFMLHKQRYAEVFGSDYWGKCLEAVGHVDRLTNRRLQRIVRE
jgi:hypothetical protein